MKKSFSVLLFAALFAYAPFTHADDRLTRIRQREAQLILCDEAYRSAVATATLSYDRALTRAHSYFEQDLYSINRDDDYEYYYGDVDVYNPRTRERNYTNNLHNVHADRRDTIDIAGQSRNEYMRLGRLEYQACVRGE